MVGRKKAWVRTYFDVTNLNGKKATSKCKFCETKSSYANATRMLEHLANQCKKCPDSVKIRAQKDFKAKAKKSKSRGSVQIDSDSDEDNPEAMAVQKSSSFTNTSNPLQNAAASSTSTSSAPAGMGKYILKTTEKQKQQLDEVLARAVYMAGQAFSTFESPYWKNAIELLRPGYEPPSAYRLRNSLLVSEYETVMDCTKEKIKSAECLAIIIDGWTNIRRENLINFIITIPEPVFLRAVPPGRNRETGEFLSTEIIQIIKTFEEDGVDVKRIFLLITDNASNMKVAWEKVREEYPHIVPIGCCAHTYNLLLTDIMKLPSILDFKKKVKTIIKEFQVHHVINALFKEFQKEKYGNNAVTLKLPPKTRWFYFVLSLQSLKANKAALQCTAIDEHAGVDNDVKKQLFDDDFWNFLNEIYNMMLPIANAITIVEGDRTVLSVVPHLNKKIRKNVLLAVSESKMLTAEEKKKIQDTVIERLYHVTSDAHLAANLLDPRRKGVDLDSVEKQSAIRFISEQCHHLDLDKAKVLGNLAEFRTKTAFFSDENIWVSACGIPPATWWGAFCTDEFLFPIAQRLFNVPSSSAPSERNWSIFTNVHTKTRNRQTNARVEKQVAIKCNMKFTPFYIKPKEPKVVMYKFDDDSDTELIDEPEPDCDLSSEYSVTDSDSGSENDDVPLVFLR